jgi:hypothetical protein
MGLRFYMRRASEWRERMGAGFTEIPARGNHLAACPRYLANLWRSKSHTARARYEQWVEERTLRDFPFAPGNRAWLRAVEEAQRVFPGTESWLLSCSAAEGGHGRWVGYGGQSYSTGLRDSNTVGGPLQFRWQTFKGMYRRALDDLRGRDWRVPSHLRDPGDDVAWRSALGQALAGGWGILHGQRSHWSASYGNGC